jgi:hypothetical protein
VLEKAVSKNRKNLKARPFNIKTINSKDISMLIYLFVFIDALIIHLLVRGSNISMLPKCSFPSWPPTAYTLPVK